MIPDLKYFCIEEYDKLDKLYKMNDSDTCSRVIARHDGKYGYFCLKENNKWRLSCGVVWVKPKLIYWNSNYERTILKFVLDETNFISCISVEYGMYDNVYKDTFLYDRHNKVWSYALRSRARDAREYKLCIDMNPCINKFTYQTNERKDFEFNYKTPSMHINNVNINSLYKSKSKSRINSIAEEFERFIKTQPIETVIRAYNDDNIAKQIKNIDKCVACLNNDIDYIFKCGHPTYCAECYPNANQNVCPICRTPSTPIKIYK